MASNVQLNFGAKFLLDFILQKVANESMNSHFEFSIL